MPSLVLFLDGDCVLAPDFPLHAAAAMGHDPQCAIVVGHLTEESAGGSIYERLSAHEWSSHTGEIEDPGNLGGIMLVRSEAFAAVGQFSEDMIAGEDSELGVRLKLNGYRLIKIDAKMATHANGIKFFRQWWRRSVRAGHAIADRYARNGQSPLKDCRRQLASTLFWGLGIPLLTLALLLPTRGWSAVLLSSYLILYLRMQRSMTRTGIAAGDTWKIAWFGLLMKFANLYGVAQYYRGRMIGRFELIEYNSPPTRIGPR